MPRRHQTAPIEEDTRTGWFLTKSGRAFFPLSPRVGEASITDIAHALSMICRYGGHSARFYSVAEHSVHVARAVAEVEPDATLEALLHDATEAYLGDMIWPLKTDIEFAHMFRIAEARLARVLAGTFGTRYPAPPIVKQMDERILVNERAVLLPKAKDPRYEWGPEWGKPIPNLDIRACCWEPSVAREVFMQTFEAEIYRRSQAKAREGLTYPLSEGRDPGVVLSPPVVKVKGAA
jgi:hypothetical protein